MSRKMALVENGIVQNIIVIAEDELGDKEIEARGGLEILNNDISIGWTYENSKFIKPPKTPEQIKSEEVLAEKLAVRKSAKEKLAALGLSPEEISAITGA